MEKEYRLQGFLVFFIAAFFLMYDQLMHAAPELAKHPMLKEMNLPHDIYGFMSVAAVWVYILTQIPIGVLYDHYSVRRILPSAIGLSSLGMFLMGWVVIPGFEMTSKILIMLGSPFAFLSMLVIGARWFTHQKFSIIAGVWQLFSTIGILLGALPLRLLDVYYLSWRVVMVIIGCLGLVLLLMALLAVEDSPSPYPLRRAGKHRYIKEVKGLLKSRQMWGIGLYAFLGWGPSVVLAKHWGVPFFMEQFSIPLNTAAWGTRGYWLAAGLLAPLMGYLSQRWKKRVPILVVSSCIGLLSSLYLFYYKGISFPEGVLGFIGIGVAVAGQVLVFAFVKDCVPKTSLGAALGLNLTFSVLGGLTFNHLVTGILSFYQPGQLGFFSLDAYRMALVGTPTFFFLSLCIALFVLKETHCQELSAAD